MHREAKNGLWAVIISAGAVVMAGLLFGCGGDAVQLNNSCTNQVLESQSVVEAQKTAGSGKTCTWADPGIFLDVETADCSKTVNGQTTTVSYKKYYYLSSNLNLYFRNGVLVFAEGNVPPCANTQLTDQEEAQDLFSPVTMYCKTNSYLFCKK